MNVKGTLSSRKDKIKFVRSIVEGIILITLLILILKALFNFTKYAPYDAKKIDSSLDSGFIAISYFGVDRNGTDSLISTENLDNHLKSLKDNGYVTITQQDIRDYYENNKPLPKKSLFLMFEDGRCDTAIFSQKITEKYNFKSTMITYADKFAKKDSKFLEPEDLKKLEKSTFWELGTNGYRLEYINVFDKDKKYLGKLTSLQFSEKEKDIRRDYNHYLMDYIRDEDGVPLESYNEMKERINYDYETSNNIYADKLGENPQLNVLMHSNTGQFGTNNKVSKINEEWIKELYKMNFNREGYSLNNNESSIYDLTRIEPQSYWPTNHLLMRIADDTKQDINFVTGDEDIASSFEEICGKAEFKDNKIMITSTPSGKGVYKLLNTKEYDDINLSVNLKGNVLGSQTVYLHSDDSFNNCLGIRLINNKINVIEKKDGTENIVYSKSLDSEKQEFDIKDLGNRKINVKLKDNNISLDVDDKNIVDDLKVSNFSDNGIYLESSCKEEGYSQRNISDDVYDGIFEDLYITDKNNNVIYSNKLTGYKKVKYKFDYYFNKILNWFITYL